MSYIFTKYQGLFLFVYCISITICQFHSKSCLFVCLFFCPRNYSRCDLFFRYYTHRFHLDRSYMSIHWRGPNQTLAHTKQWPAAHEGTGAETLTVPHRRFFAATDEVFGDILETFLVLKSALNTVMTLLNDFPMCLELDELYRQMRMCQDVAQYSGFKPYCVLKEKKRRKKKRQRVF